MYVEIPTILQISEEKLKNWLQKHKKQLESKRAWHTPLALFTPLMIIILTSSFKNTLGFEPNHVRIFFIVFTLVTCGWLIMSICNSLKSKSMYEMIIELKKELQEKEIDKKVEIPLGIKEVLVLAQNLKRHRQSKGLTQKELGLKVGLTKDTISMLELGKQENIGLKYLIMIRRELGIGMEKLFEKN